MVKSFGIVFFIVFSGCRGRRRAIDYFSTLCVFFKVEKTEKHLSVEVTTDSKKYKIIIDRLQSEYVPLKVHGASSVQVLFKRFVNSRIGTNLK